MNEKYSMLFLQVLNIDQVLNEMVEHQVQLQEEYKLHPYSSNLN